VGVGEELRAPGWTRGAVDRNPSGVPVRQLLKKQLTG
jgi:hypothetical protein